jgi:hypothetical protein
MIEVWVRPEDGSESHYMITIDTDDEDVEREISRDASAETGYPVVLRKCDHPEQA